MAQNANSDDAQTTTTTSVPYEFKSRAFVHSGAVVERYTDSDDPRDTHITARVRYPDGVGDGTEWALETDEEWSVMSIIQDPDGARVHLRRPRN